MSDKRKKAEKTNRSAAKLGEKIQTKQKRVLIAGIGVATLATAGILFLPDSSNSPKESAAKSMPVKSAFDVVSEDVNVDDIRIARLESTHDLVSQRMQALEKSLTSLQQDKYELEKEKEELSRETKALQSKVTSLEQKQRESTHELTQTTVSAEINAESASPKLHAWSFDGEGREEKERHILFEIPAGTVVKAVLVSGADCSVGVQKPTGPNMVLLRPLDNGQLPKKVRVPLKGSVIIGNAIGDISSERVYVRGERMTLVERGGKFVETEITAYISGEDGREGMRGVVVDRSGQIITRAAFASFLQGVGQGIQATLNNQTIEKLANTTSDKTILNLDMFRSSGMQGGATALNKMADYYIRRAEQLQPAIQIAAGRVVDVVFTKTIRVGEDDLKKKLEHERRVKNRGKQKESFQ